MVNILILYKNILNYVPSSVVRIAVHPAMATTCFFFFLFFYFQAFVAVVLTSVNAAVLI